jgi:putative ABC transport system ATP-binding protein
MSALTSTVTSATTISAENLGKVYGTGSARGTALDDVSLTIAEGSFTAVMGPSGSGKSTLLHCLAGLDRPTSGRIRLGGTDLTGLSDDELTRLRRDRIGFVFQSFNLLPALTAVDNITLPARIAGRTPDPQLMARLVDSLGLADRLRHRPSELSGGQQQRVAVARALLGRPDAVFADEPTGNLDSRNSAELLGMLRHAAAGLGQSVVMVTHDPKAAAYAERVVFLADGRVAGDLTAPAMEDILAELTRLEARA